MAAQAPQAGRGRGRGRGTIAPVATKPGGVYDQAPKDPMDQLSGMVKSLALDADEKEMLPFRETALKAGNSQEKLEEVINLVYQRSLEDWRFSPCAANLCYDLEKTGIQVEGVKFRNLLLSRIQTDFKNKDKVREESPQKFLGNISFVCQIFVKMRDAEGEPFKPLAGPVFEALELLLQDKASDEEMTCAAEQLYVVGKTLQGCTDKIRMTGLRNKVKDKIIHAIGSREVRVELIRVVEGFASDWRQFI